VVWGVEGGKYGGFRGRARYLLTPVSGHRFGVQMNLMMGKSVRRRWRQDSKQLLSDCPSSHLHIGENTSGNRRDYGLTPAESASAHAHEGD